MTVVLLVLWLILPTCLDAAGCEVLWSSFVPNKRPSLSHFASLPVQNSRQCYVMCARMSGCDAMAFDGSKKRCHVYGSGATTLIDALGVVFSEKRQNLHSSCQPLSTIDVTCKCPLGFVCSAVSGSRGATACIPVVLCSAPPSVAKAMVSMAMSTVGSEVTYTCMQGHVFNGSDPTATCTLYGSWTQPDGACLADCGAPPIMADAEVHYGETLLGQVALYACHVGYAFVGTSNQSVCSAGGLWEGLEGLCQRDCGVPDNMADAEVHYGGTLLGQVALYTCHMGHVFVGTSNQSACSASGLWEGLDGSCWRDCGVPLNMADAEVHYGGTLLGQVALYTCHMGHVFVGTSNQSVCNASGLWEGLDGTCLRCNDSLAVGLPNNSFSASSAYTLVFTGLVVYPAYLARINSSQGWSAVSAKTGDWLQIDLGEVKVVTGVVTKGRGDSLQFVTSYSLTWSNITSQWSGNVTFQGNEDQNTPVTQELQPPLLARFIRFNVLNFTSYPSMRADVLGCI